MSVQEFLRASTPLRLLSLAALAAIGPRAYASSCLQYTDYIHRLGELAIDGHPMNVAVWDRWAYVADGLHGVGLLIVDISDPSAPFVVGSAEVGQGTDVAVDWPHVVVARSGGFTVLRVEDPSNPEELVGVSTDTPSSVLIDRGVLYVGTGDDLRAYDFSTPSAPLLIDTLLPPTRVTDLAVGGDLLLVAGSTTGLWIVDISDPSALQVAGNLDIGAQIEGVAVVGSSGIMTSSVESRAYVVDIAEPTLPSVVSSLPMASPFLPASVGSLVFVPVFQGLTVVDLGDPLTPQVVATLALPSLGVGVSIADGLAGVTTGVGGLQIVDVSNPYSPGTLGGGDTDGLASDVLVHGGYAVVADEWNGLVMFDVSDPASPALTGDLSVPGRAVGLSIVESHVYVAGSEGGLSVVEIEDPTRPEILATVETPGPALDVAAAADFAFVAAGPGGVAIIDIAPPDGPVLLGAIPVPAGASSAAISDGFLLVGTQDPGGLQIFDVSNPEDPQFLGGFDASAEISDIAIRGDLAVLAGGTSGVFFADVSDPTLPGLIGAYDTPGHASRLSLDGSVVYVADFHGGVSILDASDPHSPVPLGAVSSSRQARGVFSAGAFVCVAEGSRGLSLVPSQCNDASASEPVRFEARLRIEPSSNPGRSAVGLRWFTPVRVPAVVSVHDVTGRLVRQLDEGVFESGWHGSTWNGRSRGGADVPTGRYFVRVRTPWGAASSPIAWFR